MYQKCGTKARTKFTDITKLSNALVRSVCSALIGVHAFTGCDTVSTFAGRGKITTFKQLKSDQTYQEAFTELGRSWIVFEELSEKMEEITCRMYLPCTHTTKVNNLRCQIFCVRRGEVDSSQLPPCKDCLSMHILCANYQAATWQRCLEPSTRVPSSTDHGWATDDDGNLVVEWMCGSPAPDVILQFLSCKCSRSCKLPACTCLSDGLKCT